jgi:hypothetical protein
MPIRTEPQMSGKHGERYGLITFGELHNGESIETFRDDFPFLMESNGGDMVMYSSMRSLQVSDPTNTDEKINEQLNDQGYPVELIRILAYARSQGFDYVLIDRDCDKTLPAGE